MPGHVLARILEAARTGAAAAGLRDDFGLSPGDRVAIVRRNRPEYLEALFAIWHAGLVTVPVNARLHRDEIAYILEHSETAVVVTSACVPSQPRRASREPGRVQEGSRDPQPRFARAGERRRRAPARSAR